MLVRPLALALLAGAVAAPAPARIVVGVEYILLDDHRVPLRARTFAGTGATAAKPYAEHVQWGEMQRGPTAPVDFRRLDAFVAAFQREGFADLVVCLKSHSSWASKQSSRLVTTNPTPKPAFVDDYERWIGAVVERYDADGVADMPGLRRPVRLYEIGSELSTYEPEPAAQYVAMLERAYAAAHAAYPDVLVAHAAFLTTTVFEGHPGPGGYEAAFAAASPRIRHHGLAEMRRVLDAHKSFDVLNVHSLGDPTEIEDIVRWLDYEARLRGFRKPIVISDTASTPFVAWGPATVCDLRPGQMGLLVAPATEADRCRLAAFFQRLVDGDEATVRWTQGFVAADTVQRVVIAAEQGVMLVNTAFVEDLHLLKHPLLRAGAGTPAWSGMADLQRGELRPIFYAVRQLVAQLGGYDAIRRVPMGRDDVRVYEIREGETRRWVAWLEPGRLVLPGDAVPALEVRLVTGMPSVAVERTIVDFGRETPERERVRTDRGALALALTPAPVFVTP